MKKKTIKIALKGVPHDYDKSLVLKIFRHRLNRNVIYTRDHNADLVIVGPFERRPRFLEKINKKLTTILGGKLRGRGIPKLYHSSEYRLVDYSQFDFVISSNSDVLHDNYFRHPYWMEAMEWSHEGVPKQENARFGEPINLEQLCRPLGSQFRLRSRRAALFSSHLFYPRLELKVLVENFLPVDCFGAAFSGLASANNSPHDSKSMVLKNYAFNLCPENSISPGYITEKVPEAFAAGCLPITWADKSIFDDFNSAAFINLYTDSTTSPSKALEVLLDDDSLNEFAQQPLLFKPVSIEPLVSYLSSLLADIES